jgi:hypothetical protein
VDAVAALTFARDPDLAGAAITRAVTLWVNGLTVDATAAARKAGKGHDAETIDAQILHEDPPGTSQVDEARLSTTYDADGRPLRAGIEMWMSEDSPYARRAAGDALCAATLETEGGRWDCAFLRWRMEGSTGIGPYAVWRAAGRR